MKNNQQQNKRRQSKKPWTKNRTKCGEYYQRNDIRTPKLKKGPNTDTNKKTLKITKFYNTKKNFKFLLDRKKMRTEMRNQDRIRSLRTALNVENML